MKAVPWKVIGHSLLFIPTNKSKMLSLPVQVSLNHLSTLSLDPRYGTKEDVPDRKGSLPEGQ